MNNCEKNTKKLDQVQTLYQELISDYPESISEILLTLLDMKEFYKGKRDYQIKKSKVQKSIEQEYVVFEELVETNNG